MFKFVPTENQFRKFSGCGFGEASKKILIRTSN